MNALSKKGWIPDSEESKGVSLEGSRDGILIKIEWIGVWGWETEPNFTRISSVNQISEMCQRF